MGNTTIASGSQPAIGAEKTGFGVDRVSAKKIGGGVDPKGRHSSYRQSAFLRGCMGRLHAGIHQPVDAKTRRSAMKRFFALFQIPASVMEDWKKNTKPDEMKA